MFFLFKFIHVFFKLDRSGTPDEFEEFFKELGSGSAELVPPATDDDQEFEKKEVVCIAVIIYVNSVFIVN